MSSAYLGEVEINLGSAGRGTIKVDGHDWSNRVFKVELIGHINEPTVVVLYMRAVEVKVMASAWVSHKMLMLDPETMQEAEKPQDG